MRTPLKTIKLPGPWPDEGTGNQSTSDLRTYRASEPTSPRILFFFSGKLSNAASFDPDGGGVGGCAFAACVYCDIINTPDVRRDALSVDSAEKRVGSNLFH